MAINQAWQHSSRGQIDGLSIGRMARERRGIAYFLNSILFNQNRLIGQHTPTTRVKKSCCFDEYERFRGSLSPHGSARTHEQNRDELLDHFASWDNPTQVSSKLLKDP